MSDTQASLRYAAALFALAKEKNELEKVDADFIQVIDILRRHKEISHLVLNSTISRDEIEDLIEKIFPENLSKTLLHFVKVLIHKMRFAQVDDIQVCYHRLYEKAKGVQEVKVVSPKALTQKVKDKIIQTLESKLKADIRLVEETDPTMIGGLIIQFDGKEVNTSYRDRLLEIKQILLQ